MAHESQISFLLKVKALMAEKFKNCRVLDIGSLDLNGNNRYLFEDYKYLGVDIGYGENVDLVCCGHEVKDAHPTWQKSVELLGYSDNTTLYEGLSKMWEWAKIQPKRERFIWSEYEIDNGIYSFWKK